MNIKTFCASFALLTFLISHAQSDRGWYTEGNDFAPEQRIRISVTNVLDIPLESQPIVVKREQLPIQNIPERWIAVVDPKLPSNPEPTFEELKEMSGYLRRKETNGHSIVLQVDDLDKDGIWDEIFFISDLAPKETRDFYIYIGFYERGMYEHLVHAGIGNYGRHTVPFWESKDMGWKLWYPHDLDVHGKRDPMLTAYYEYSTNNSGYYMPWEMGTDIMTVANTFGGGGICVFEDPTDPEHPTRAYHSPHKDKGPYMDTRYAYDVVYNGPLRSMIEVTTTNWNSEKGFYELKQYYSAYAHKSWSTVQVAFDKFMPPANNAMFGVGMRKIMEEYQSVNKPGIAISMGKDIEARIPDEDIGEDVLIVPWQGIGIVVKEKYNPTYHQIDNYGGNHVFMIPQTADHRYEYMVIDGWSFGKVNNSEANFVRYVETEAKKYNHPPVVKVYELEKKNP